MSFHRQLVEAAKARRRFFDAPPNGRYSSELDIDLSPAAMRRERESKHRRVIRIVNRDVPQVLPIRREDAPLLPRRTASMNAIARAVCQHYGFTPTDVFSERRTKNLMRPRQVAYYLCKELTTQSLPCIGRVLGGRDHTTILHGVQKITRLLATDAKLAADIAAIRSALAQRFDIAQEAGG